MTARTEPGRFITLEGGEGAGKTTQAKMLRDALADVGVDAILTREPGGAPGAEDIRKLLVEGEPGRWLPLTEALLHYAARYEHVNNSIAPALADGKWVICDRFADSTAAYQGFGHGLDREVVQRLHRLVIGGLAPDLTIIFDIAPEDGMRRAAERSGTEDRYERMDLDFHRRLRDGFLQIAKRDLARCAVIDASGSIDEVAKAIRAVVTARLKVGLMDG